MARALAGRAVGRTRALGDRNRTVTLRCKASLGDPADAQFQGSKAGKGSASALQAALGEGSARAGTTATLT